MKDRLFPGKSYHEGMKWTRRKMSWSSFHLSEIYSWGLGSNAQQLMIIWSYANHSWTPILSLFSCKKAGETLIKRFQSCLWRLLVFIVTSRVTAGLWGESSWVRLQSHAVPSPTPPPLPGEGHLQMLEQPPQSTAFIINILLKMDPHCPENKVRLQVRNVAPQIISHSPSYFKPVLCSSILMPWMTYLTISAFENFPHSSNPRSRNMFVPMKPPLLLFSHLFPILSHPFPSAHYITPSYL